MSEEGQARSRGGRGRRRGAGVRLLSRSAAYRSLVNPFGPVPVLEPEGVEAIHAAALTLLEEEGIRVLLPEARARLAAAGAVADEETGMVRLDRGLVTHAVGLAPRVFELGARTPSRTATIGGRSLVTVPVGGPPHVSDLDRGKRPGTLADYHDFTRLVQHFDVMHLQSPCVEPQDVPVHERHLETMHASLTLADKPAFVYARGREQVRDAFEMVRIAHGLDPDAFAAQPSCYTVINTNSPRQLDVPMCLGIVDFAAAGQASVITPFTLAGAMAPITIAGALTLQHAEAMAGITLAQIVRAGAPVVYGAFTSNVDMRSGAPAFGTPEYVKAALASGQLARHIGIPWRSSAPNASNAVDAQASYEFMMSLFGAVLGGCNVLIHAAGWLEGGLTASKEKFVLDVEVLQMLAEAFQPVTVDDDEIGLDAIREVAPGGHFFGGSHTLARYETAFYAPIVSDWSNFGQWTEAGAKNATERANASWKRILAGYEAPPIDDAVAEELAEYVARRKREGGAAPPS